MGFENHEFEAEQGPSWQRPNWRFGETDELTGALDPTQMAVEIKAAAKAAQNGSPSATLPVRPRKPPSIIRSPWAKFTISVAL